MNRNVTESGFQVYLEPLHVSIGGNVTYEPSGIV
ncbi:hypothetical protein FHS16_003016 [Paenibacillus endophyticus]|uniref:Uncharacterized protein n=1 Tax=Paenibacillus endophyticus TaxID=1294268 RepID=A0A7W5C890_9BACL|nr:hypothetical protein [Paenibacillus endophyticus]